MPEIVTITPLLGVYTSGITIQEVTSNLYPFVLKDTLQSGPAVAVVTGTISGYNWGTDVMTSGPIVVALDGFTTRTRLDLFPNETVNTPGAAAVPTGTFIQTLRPVAVSESMLTLGNALAPTGTLVRTLITTAVSEQISTPGPALTPTGTLL